MLKKLIFVTASSTETNNQEKIDIQSVDEPNWLQDY